MAEILQIDSIFLNEVMEMASRTVVGKVLKRFETIENRDVLKKEIKELLYEEHRTLKALLEAHARGLAITQVIFKSEKPTATT